MKNFIQEFKNVQVYIIITMVSVQLLILYILFFVFPKYQLDRDLKYIITTVIGFFTIPFIMMYYVRNLLINKLILRYKSDLREIIDRTVISGNIEESLYIKLLKKNRLEKFSLKKPIIEVPDLTDCENLITFKNNLMEINDNTYDISQISYYFIRIVRFKSTIYHHSLFFGINNDNHNEKVDTIDKNKVLRISEMLYKSLLEYNSDFDFPSIRISKKINTNN